MTYRVTVSTIHGPQLYEVFTNAELAADYMNRMAQLPAAIITIERVLS